MRSVYCSGVSGMCGSSRLDAFPQQVTTTGDIGIAGPEFDHFGLAKHPLAQVASFLTSDFLFQLEPLPLPPRYAPQHLLHFSIEAREADRRFIRSVAVGAGAVDHEGDAGRECGEVALDDSAVGQVDGSGDVAGGISVRAGDR